MDSRTKGRIARDVLEELVVGVSGMDIPPDVAAIGREATLRGLQISADTITDERMERRIRAYFHAVVKRRVVRRRGPRLAAARLFADAIVADLRGAGRSGSDILEELERGCSHRLPSELVDEYRLRLAG